MLTFEYVNECLSYDPDTGDLRRKHRPREHFKTIRAYNTWNTRFADRVADFMSAEGYITVGLNNKQYKGHRVAWLLHTGAWPMDQIDHIDGNRSNNAIKTLREATKSQNQCNTPKYASNTSGIRGVWWHKANNKWVAAVRSNGKLLYLGCFNDINDAKNAYIAAARKYHGEFARVD